MLAMYQAQPQSNDDLFYQAYFWLFDFVKLGCVPINDDGIPYPGTDPLGARNLEIRDIRHVGRGRFNLKFSTDSVGTSFTFMKAAPPLPDYIPPPPRDRFGKAIPVPKPKKPPSKADIAKAKVEAKRLAEIASFQDLNYNPLHDSIGFADPGVTDPFNLLFPQITRIADTGPLLTDFYRGLEFQSKARSVKMSTREFYHLSYRTHACQVLEGS